MITPQKDTLINHYDPEGLRAEIEENQKLTKFIFHQGDILLETDSEDNTLSRFTRGYAIASADIYNDKLAQSRYYYQQDEQYSTAFITDKEGTIKNFYKYDAFGNILESQETLPNRITYTGQQYDAITQQYYLRARFYNPILGRFMQEDPYHGDGLNLYAYCKNNPVMYYDPSGYAAKEPNCSDKGDQGPEDNGSGVPEGSSATNLGGDNVASESSNTKGATKPSSKLVGDGVDLPWLSDNYRAVDVSGTVKVSGEVRDVSRRVYQRTDIDWDYVSSHPDALGRSNRELAKKGNAPFHTDDTRIELHHLTQTEPGGMVEIPGSLHDDYTSTLHGLVEDGGSFRNNPVLEKQYNNFNSKYWRWRIKQEK